MRFFATYARQVGGKLNPSAQLTASHQGVPGRALVLACALAIAVLAVVFALPAPAFAGGLAFESSCPEDGAVAVPAEGRMWIRFDHNIAAVEGNVELARLLDANGEEVPAERCKVALPDFETEFGYRQYLFFDVKGLEPGARYTMHVDAGVQAKNGSSCDEPLDITFTTAKEGERAMELVAPTEKEGGTGDGSGNGAGNGSQGGEGDIELTQWVVANAADDSPRPTEMPSTMAHYAVLTFSKGVDYCPSQEGADISYLQENAARVSLQKSDGTKVEGAKTYTLDSKSEERPGNIYLDLEEGARLAPLTNYQIVVEPGITTYSGAYRSTQRYEVPFRTNGDIGGGLTVAHVLVAAAIAFAVGTGIVVQIRRRKQEKECAHG